MVNSKDQIFGWTVPLNDSCLLIYLHQKEDIADVEESIAQGQDQDILNKATLPFIAFN